MKYLVTLGGREIEVEVDGEKVTVGGVTRTATLMTVAGTPKNRMETKVMSTIIGSVMSGTSALLRCTRNSKTMIATTATSSFPTSARSAVTTIA